jgi:uncharacterized repeat protein (TIGR03803 family)
MNSDKTQSNKSGGCKTACVIFLFCIAVAIGSPAQTAPAQTFTTLANFNKINGWAPYLGSLVQGTDGNLYGTTEYGGANKKNSGTVFRLAPNGPLTTIYSFCSQLGCTDGAGPYGGLVLGTDGNFYGTTTQSGAHGGGTVFKITPAGALTTIYNFCSQPGCTDGYGSYAGLALGTDGNFYGTSGGYGSNNQGTIFKITPAGALTTLHTFQGTDGSTPGGVLVQASDGNFYGTTPFGGATIACGGFFLGCGTVYKITPGGTLTTLHSFSGGAAGNRPEAGLIQGADGNLYGTTAEGGTGSSCSDGCGTVFKITTSGTLTTLHSFDTVDGSYPSSPVIQATDRNFYGTTNTGGASTACVYGCGTVFEMTTAGTVTTLHSFDSTDGASPAAGLVQAPTGTFYGTTSGGGVSHACDYGACGTAFSLAVGLGPFLETVPAGGKVGASVIIEGAKLTGATSVTFNGIAAAFTVVSGTEITTTVPAGATTGPVKVTKPNGTLSSNVPFRVTK